MKFIIVLFSLILSPWNAFAAGAEVLKYARSWRLFGELLEETLN